MVNQLCTQLPFFDLLVYLLYNHPDLATYLSSTFIVNLCDLFVFENGGEGLQLGESSSDNGNALLFDVTLGLSTLVSDLFQK